MRFVLALILSTALALPGWGAAQLLNGVAVIVDGTIITYEDVQHDLDLEYQLLQKRYGQNRQALQEKMAERQKEILEWHVERQLILSEFKRMGAVLPETIIDRYVEEEIREKFGDRATFARTLKAEGRTLEQFRREIRERIIISELRQINVNREIIISPHKIETYYVLNRAKFRVGDQVKLRMMLLTQKPGGSSARDLALEILGKIRSGTPFAEMATAYSEGRERTKGGDYGWMEPNQLLPYLSEAAFDLDAGQLGPVLGIARQEGATVVCFYDDQGKVIKTRRYNAEEKRVEEKTGAEAVEPAPAPTDFWIIQVEDKRVAFSRPLAEVRDEIEKLLREEEHARLNKLWIDKLKKKSFVRYFF